MMLFASRTRARLPPPAVRSALPSLARRFTGGRVDLWVPFADKDEAKRLGARFDMDKKVWYAPDSQPALLERFGEFLEVPEAERPEAVQKGAVQSRVSGLLYAPQGSPQRAELVARWGSAGRKAAVAAQGQPATPAASPAPQQSSTQQPQPQAEKTVPQQAPTAPQTQQAPKAPQQAPKAPQTQQVPKAPQTPTPHAAPSTPPVPPVVPRTQPSGVSAARPTSPPTGAASPSPSGSKHVLLSYPLTPPERALQGVQIPFADAEHREQMRPAWADLRRAGFVTAMVRSKEFCGIFVAATRDRIVSEMQPELSQLLLRQAQVRNLGLDETPWLWRNLVIEALYDSWRKQSIALGNETRQLDGVGPVQALHDGQGSFVFEAETFMKIETNVLGLRTVKVRPIWGYSSDGPLARRIDIHAGTLFTTERPPELRQVRKGLEVRAAGGKHFAGIVEGLGDPIGAPIDAPWAKGMSLIEYNVQRWPERRAMLQGADPTEPCVMVRSNTNNTVLPFPRHILREVVRGITTTAAQIGPKGRAQITAGARKLLDPEKLESGLGLQLAHELVDIPGARYRIMPFKNRIVAHRGSSCTRPSDVLKYGPAVGPSPRNGHAPQLCLHAAVPLGTSGVDHVSMVKLTKDIRKQLASWHGADAVVVPASDDEQRGRCLEYDVGGARVNDRAVEQSIARLGRELNMADSSTRRVVMCLLPGAGQGQRPERAAVEIWGAAHRGAKAAGIGLQCATMSSLRQIDMSTMPLALGANEAAGGQGLLVRELAKDDTIFLGVDVCLWSREAHAHRGGSSRLEEIPSAADHWPESSEGRAARAAVTVIDGADGRLLPSPPPLEDFSSRENLPKSFYLEALKIAAEHFKSQGRTLRRIVLHRDGRVTPMEMLMLKQAVQEAVGPEAQLDCVSIKKTGAPRLLDRAAARRYLSVPMSQKDEAKSLGAKWDSDEKCWFAPDGVSQQTQTLVSRWGDPNRTGGGFVQPQQGSCVHLFSNRSLITTVGGPEYSHLPGTVRPLLVDLVSAGSGAPQDQICEEVFLLSMIPVDSARSTRLPISTHCAHERAWAPF